MKNSSARLYFSALAQTPLNDQSEAGEQPILNLIGQRRMRRFSLYARFSYTRDFANWLGSRVGKKNSSAPLHNVERRLYCAALAQTALNGQDEAGEQPNLK